MHSYKVAALLVSGLLAGLGGCSRHANHEADERYIVDGERQWAESVASGDTAVVERLLAEDYLGVAPDGTLRTKQAEIAGLRSGAAQVLSNHVGDVKVRFYGDTAIAQGAETWELRAGEPRRGRYVWTDTWLRRNNRWQIVAAEDLTAPAP